MPLCVLGAHCQYPKLALRNGHKCRQCHKPVHVLCAEEDPAADTSANLTCFLCTNPPKFQQSSPHLPDSHSNANNNTPSPTATLPPYPPTTTDQSLQPPLPPIQTTFPPRNTAQSKRTSSSQAKRKAPPCNPKPRTKYNKDLFRLDVDNSKPDPLLMKPVAFDVDDNMYGTQLYTHFGGDENARKYLKRRNEKRVLIGTIVRVSNKKKSGHGASSTIHYDVQWEESDLGDTPIHMSVIIDAVAFYQVISSKKLSPSTGNKSSNLNPLTPEIKQLLFRVDDTEVGTPEASDDEDERENGNENDDMHSFYPHPLFDNPNKFKEIIADHDEIYDGSDFCWSTGKLPPPPDRSDRCTSHVVPSKTSSFATPISSLLSFIPLKIFNSIAFYSNLYAHCIVNNSENGNVSGRKWESDITINEIMKFFGILFKMVLRPTPGQSYPFCWDDTQWHPYTAYMRLRRFQQIRSVLHFNDNSTIGGSNDAAFKVRPLLNCLKITFPQYLELGNEVALDEASVSCRSRYGGEVIFYNPRKPSGKFHFRFYMLCCSSSYACVRLRMHTRNKSDVADAPASPSLARTAIARRTTTSATAPTKAGPKTTGLEDDESIETNEENREFGEDAISQKNTGGVLLSLIMDMCQPLYGSGRVVNMDNYYTSPTAAWMLSNEKVYMRGTCRTNRKGFPTGISFSGNEKNRWDRGTAKCMIEKRKRMAAFGWLDGNPVHFITTADGNDVTTVQRRVGRERRTIEAPVGIKNYNMGMQAVDRHDQLREGFSLSARHGFKKYYLKVALGLIDMAVVNAWIHYKLVNPEQCNNERSRYDFMDSIANSLLDINWQDYHQADVPGDIDENMHLLLRDRNSDGGRTMEVENMCINETDNRCTPIAVQLIMAQRRSLKKGLSCQVCSYEGRGASITRNVVACRTHRIRACNINREDKNLMKADGSIVTDYSWRAPMPGASCWDKMHKFYIPRGLFRENVVPITIVDQNTVFQCCRVGSDLYKRKKIALGETETVRSRKKLDLDL